MDACAAVTRAAHPINGHVPASGHAPKRMVDAKPLAAPDLSCSLRRAAAGQAGRNMPDHHNRPAAKGSNCQSPLSIADRTPRGAGVELEKIRPSSSLNRRTPDAAPAAKAGRIAAACPPKPWRRLAAVAARPLKISRRSISMCAAALLESVGVTIRAGRLSAETPGRRKQARRSCRRC